MKNSYLRGNVKKRLLIQLAVTTSRLGGAYSGIAGAIIDPESSSSLDANRDGRIYATSNFW